MYASAPRFDQRESTMGPMPTIRKVAAALTICIGCALFLIALRLDFPLADGDGGFVSPGMLLAVIFGGAPVITGVVAYRLSAGAPAGRHAPTADQSAKTAPRHHEP